MLEIIIAMLEKMSEDVEYYVHKVEGEKPELEITVYDFEGFDEDWSEVERELKNHKAVEEVLEWLEENADEVEGDYYEYYHFGEITVCVGYASFDI